MVVSCERGASLHKAKHSEMEATRPKLVDPQSLEALGTR